jgi:hypothetical protein
MDIHQIMKHDERIEIIHRENYWLIDVKYPFDMDMNRYDIDSYILWENNEYKKEFDYFQDL